RRKGPAVNPDTLHNLRQLWEALVNLLAPFGHLLLWALPLLLWFAYWLGAVNWQKAWPWLAKGAWIPLVLLVIVATLVWAQLSPGAGHYLGLLPLPTYWWHLANVTTLVGVALFAGWLQGVLGWAPEEVNIEPAGPGHHHGHH